jgi:hypothetical protein
MENYNYLLGFLNPLLFGTMVLFSALGIAISLLWDAQGRDQSSVHTPEKFSLKFLLRDNWKTIVVTILVVLLTLRFAPNLFPDQFKGEDIGQPAGVEKWLFGSFLIGLVYNQLVQFLKKKISILNVER